MVEYGADVAKRNGVENLEYRLGDLEELPIESGAVDLVLMHQTLHHALHPDKAMEEAWRILQPGGRIVILDLLKHEFEGARELYGDVWQGFSQVELMELLRKAGFEAIDISIVDREEEGPHFQIMMAIAEKVR
jgi:ArsR family transcriptional regulator